MNGRRRLAAAGLVIAMSAGATLAGSIGAVPASADQPNSWTTVAPMPYAAGYLAASAGQGGRIYAVGGYGNPSYLIHNRAYHVASDTWTIRPPMPTARALLAAATGPDGRIYAIGGYNGNDLSTVQAHDPTNGTWTIVAPMPSARSRLAAVTGSDGRIYAIGGSHPLPTPTVQVYNVSTNTWTIGAPMPTARSDLAAALGPDGRIYAIGGYNGSYLSTVEAYNPSTNTWTTVAPMPTARSNLAAALGPDGRIYAIGGYNGSYLSTVEAYNPSTNTWTTAAPMPTARAGLASVEGSDGRIYAIGGDTGSYPFVQTVEAYTVGSLLTGHFVGFLGLGASGRPGRFTLDLSSPDGRRLTGEMCLSPERCTSVGGMTGSGEVTLTGRGAEARNLVLHVNPFGDPVDCTWCLLVGDYRIARPDGTHDDGQVVAVRQVFDGGDAAGGGEWSGHARAVGDPDLVPVDASFTQDRQGRIAGRLDWMIQDPPSDRSFDIAGQTLGAAMDGELLLVGTTGDELLAASLDFEIGESGPRLEGSYRMLHDVDGARGERGSLELMRQATGDIGTDGGGTGPS